MGSLILIHLVVFHAALHAEHALLSAFFGVGKGVLEHEKFHGAKCESEQRENQGLNDSDIKLVAPVHVDECSNINADSEQINGNEVSHTEPHHHLSIEFDVRPSGFEYGETVEVRVEDLVQFEYRDQRQDSDHHREAGVTLSVSSEFIVRVSSELLFGFDKGKLSSTD